MDGNNSFFDKDLHVDFSWILKLSDEDRVDYGAAESSAKPASESSSPEHPSSGYLSLGDDQGSGSGSGSSPSTSQIIQRPTNPSGSKTEWPHLDSTPRTIDNFPLSQSVGQATETIRLWSGAGVVGQKSLFQMLNAGLPYFLKAAPIALFANEEAIFYFVTAPSSSATHIVNTPMTVFAQVTHSSGFVTNVEMQKLELIPGFRCSFMPFFSGKYSAKVYQQPDMKGRHLHKADLPGGLVCAPLELDVSRNYNMEARNPTCPAINLDENGEKYWGIAVDKFSDKLYIADRQKNDILILDPWVGKPVFRFGQDPSLTTDNKLFRPTGLVVDGVNKRILVCNKDNHRISIFSIDGIFISSFGKKGHSPGEFNYPWDIDISPNGDMIAVSDSRNHRVQIFDRFGNYLKKFTVFEQDPFEYKSKFDYPRGICFDRDGQTLYITDFNTNNVVKLDVESLEYRQLVPQGKMSRPQGISVDEMGNLLVCDSRKNCLRVMCPEGNLLTSIGKVGRSQVYLPADSCVFRSGQVATLGINGRIHFF